MTTKQNKELVEAIVSRDSATLRSALAAGADPNAAVQGTHPLLLAVIAGSRPNIDLLLKHGANPVARDGAGRSALHYAAMGSPEADDGIVSSLLQAGCDPSAKDLRGATPLDLASGAGNEETALELVNAGATCRPDRAAWVKRLTITDQSPGARGRP